MGTTLASYANLPEATKAHFTALEDFIGNVDGETTIYDETIDAEDAAVAFNGLLAEIDRLRTALDPFAEVARWAERNGHDLAKGWDMLLRAPDGSIAGHLGVQSPQFIEARRALEQGGQQKP